VRPRPRAWRALALLALVLALGGTLLAPAAALGSATPRARPHQTASADAAAPIGGTTGAVGPTAPSAPSSDAVESPTADAAASSPESGGDPLAENGFGSVLCREPSVERSLSAAAQGNCATSSFVAAAAPTGNYALDVHIDTGILSVPIGNLIAVCIQNFVLVPVWTALVWIVHALLVGIEWCYTLNLLNGATLGSVASVLRAVQATVTQPLFALALAVASVLALYHGLVRRRVAQTLAEVLVMFAMMAAGLWVVLDPVGTIGTLGQWTDQASLGVLASVTSGQPTGGDASLASATGEVFGSVIGGPWCYLEFGDVDWCRQTDRLDPQLRAAAQAIAAQERGSSTPAERTSALLLEHAQTNGDLFLALPANGPQRNSINDTGSLLRVLCGSSDATSCIGSTASQAEFRTAGGTLARGGGLLLIAAGASGMIAVLIFIVARLLGAAVSTLLYLLLAPVIVLAPAFGEGGRSAFRTWATRLLGALVSKLVYSLVLGVVLLILRVIEGLGTLGWWTQWLLASCLWWTAFARRHQLLEYLHAPRDEADVVRFARTRVLNPGTTLSYGRELRRLLREHRGDGTPPEVKRKPTVSEPASRGDGGGGSGKPGGRGSDPGPGSGPGSGPGPGSGRPGSGDPAGGVEAPAGPAGPRPGLGGLSEVVADGRRGELPANDHAPVAGALIARPGPMGLAEPERADGPRHDRLATLQRERQAALAAGEIRRAASLQRRADELGRQGSPGAPTPVEAGAPPAARVRDRQSSPAELHESSRERDAGRSSARPAGLTAATQALLSAGKPRHDARQTIDGELDARRRVDAGRTDSTERPPAPALPAALPRPASEPPEAAGGETPVGDRTPGSPARRRETARARPAADSVVIRRERQFAAARDGDREGEPGRPVPRPTPAARDGQADRP